MSTDGHRTKWRRNVAENFNCLSRAHERFRQTDIQTDDRRTDDNIANVSGEGGYRNRLERGAAFSKIHVATPENCSLFARNGFGANPTENGTSFITTMGLFRGENFPGKKFFRGKCPKLPDWEISQRKKNVWVEMTGFDAGLQVCTFSGYDL